MPGSIKNRKIKITFDGKEYDVNTNKRGLMRISLKVENGKEINYKNFQFFIMKKNKKLKIELPEPFMHCFFVKGNPSLGVISDIDDTVLVTHTQNPIRRIRTLLVKNAYKRKIVHEMKTLFHNFHDMGYDFFYVSNSEANLYPMIRLFLEHQGLPLGPLFLKSFRKWKSIFKRKRKRDKGYHKKEKIQMLLDIFPDMKFVLIGDDSQLDPEIYTYFAQKYPERIKEILIRHVSNKITPSRNKEKKKLAQEQNVTLTYFKNPKELLTP
jgi:phosphatidate phosphatase APP1